VSSRRHYYATREEVERGEAVEGWHVQWRYSPQLGVRYSSPFLTRPEAVRCATEHPHLKHTEGAGVEPVWLTTIWGQTVAFPDGAKLRERVIRGLRQNEGGLVDGKPPHYSGFAYREGVWYAVEKPWDDARWQEPWVCVSVLATCYAPAGGSNFQAIFEKLRGR
jgi:hypothetical protein